MAPSNYAVIGRYILPKEIFKVLKSQKPGKNNEIHITDAIKKLINDKNKFIVFSADSIAGAAHLSEDNLRNLLPR